MKKSIAFEGSLPIAFGLGWLLRRSGIKIQPRKPEFDDIEKGRLRSLGYIK